MGKKCFFWRGVRIFGTLIRWKPFAIPLSSIEKQGTSRLLGELSVQSRNYLYDIKVTTQVEPQETYTAPDTALTIGRQGVFNLKFGQYQKQIVGLARGKRAVALGDLSWCEDDAETLGISGVTPPGGPTYPGAGVIAFTGLGFVPAEGQYVLLRERTSGEGFVTQITGIPGAGFFACVLNQEVTTDWEVFLVRFFYPNTAYVQIEGYDNPTQVDDCWTPELVTAFKSKSHMVYPSTYAFDLG